MCRNRYNEDHDNLLVTVHDRHSSNKTAAPTNLTNTDSISLQSQIQKMNVVKKALLSTLIALASFKSISSAQAAPVTWVSGDIFLGFENATGSLNYLYDLGAGSTFAASVLAGSYAGINLNADLTTVFGSDWATNATTAVSYGIFGLPASKAVVYATVANGNLAPVLKSSGQLTSSALPHYNALGAGYNTDIGNINQGSMTLGVKQIPGSGTDTSFSSWSGNSPSVAPFATYNASFENLVSGKLDFYSTTGSTSTLNGTMQISQAGVFGIVAVPEPGTYALFGLGALALIVAYRRKSKETAA